MTYFLHSNEKSSEENKVQRPQSYIVIERSRSKQCSTLKIGALFFAWVTAIVPIALLVFMAMATVKMVKQLVDFGFVDKDTVGTAMITFPIITALFFITAVNVYGVHMDEPTCMKPWLISNLTLILFIVIIVLCVVTNIIKMEMSSEKYMSFNDLVFVIGVVVHTVAFFIEYMHFRKIYTTPEVHTCPHI